MATAAFVPWIGGFRVGGRVVCGAFVCGATVGCAFCCGLGGGGFCGGFGGDRGLRCGFCGGFGADLCIFRDALCSYAFESCGATCGLATLFFVRRAVSDPLAHDITNSSRGTVCGLATSTELVGDKLDALALSALCTGVGLGAVFNADVEAGDTKKALFAAIDSIASLSNTLVSCAILYTDALLARVGHALFPLGAGLCNSGRTSTTKTLEDQVTATACAACSVVLAEADVDEGRAASACLTS